MSGVACIILNWNNSRLTIECINSLYDSDCCDIYVVDNGSSDNSVANLKAEKRITQLILNNRNAGFAGGMNLGLKTIIDEKYEYVILLNNDVKFNKSTIQALKNKIDSDKNYAAVTPLIYDTNDRDGHCGGYLSLLSLKLNSTSDEIKLNSHKYSWLTAASLMIRVDALKEIGLLNEKYFMYWEDFDLCIRFKKKNYNLGVATNARAVHNAGTSSSHIVSRRYLWHYKSAKLWIEDHHPYPRYAWNLYKLKFWMKVLFTLRLDIYSEWKLLKLNSRP